MNPFIPPAARVANALTVTVGVVMALPGWLFGILYLGQMIRAIDAESRMWSATLSLIFLLPLGIPGLIYILAGLRLLRPQRRLPRTITITAAIGTFIGLWVQTWFGELISPGLLLIAAHGGVLLSVILATRAWQQAFKSGYATPTGYGFQPIINLPPQARRHYPTPPPPAMGSNHHREPNHSR